MILDKVTSLFDLEQKAKTNAYYRQLAMITFAIVDDVPMTMYVGKVISDEDFGYGMIRLTMRTKGLSCKFVVSNINNCMRYLKEIPVNAPATPKPTLVKKSCLANDYLTTGDLTDEWSLDDFV